MAAKPELEVKTKLCARCLTKKPLDDFSDYPKSNERKGKKSCCKRCTTDLMHIWAQGY